MSLYSHLPENSVRLLELLPDVDNVKVIVRCVSLATDVPAFEALSYTWGTEAPTETIQCMKSSEKGELFSFAVTPSLHTAFECLRATAGKHQSRWLWIDAICINQQDNDEKARQVPLMADIYSTAQRVVVWLGKNDSSSDVVMKEMPALATKLSEIEDLSAVGFTTVSSFGLPSGEDEIWEHSAAWFDRDWFRRLWVLQEFYLAKSVIFLCGHESISSEHVVTFANAFRSTQMVVKSRHTDGEPPGLTFLVRPSKSLLEDPSSPARLFFIPIARDLLCKEPVDHVYGILGLLPRTFRDQIRVDYSEKNKRNPAALFTHFGKVILENSLPLNRFVLFWSMTSSHFPGTPSWLPALISPIDGQAFLSERAGWPRDPTSPYYEATIWTSLSTPPPQLSHPDNIKIRGVIVDIVVSTIQLDWVYLSNGSTVYVTDVPAFITLESSCAALAREVGVSVPSTAYCTTLIANRDLVSGSFYDPDKTVQDYQDSMAYLRQVGISGVASNFRISQPREYRYVFSLHEKWRGGRSFFATAHGRIGLGGWNGNLQAGDRVCILFGAHQLFILRGTRTPGVYSMVGDSYVDGLMNCEIFDTKGFAEEECVFEIC